MRHVIVCISWRKSSCKWTCAVQIYVVWGVTDYVTQFVFPLISDELLGCISLLAVVNGAGMNIHVEASVGVHTSNFWGLDLGIVLPGHMVILHFWGICELFSTVATSSSILPSKIQGSSVSLCSHHLLILCTLVIFSCFWSLHWSYLRCEVVSHCGFKLHFSNDKSC